MTTSAQVLVTNDDGNQAAGIRSLTAALVASGLSVVVVSPRENQSGTSHFAKFNAPVQVAKMPDRDGAQLYVCDGTPVDCVRSAVIGDIAPDVEVVVSGINHGCNFGDDTLGSGTFGGAAQGALLGLPAIAFSQQSYRGQFSIFDVVDHSTLDFGDAARAAAMFVHALLDYGAPDRAVLNVNLPAVLSDPRAEVTVGGRRHWARNAIAPVERDGVTGYLTFGSREQPDAPWQTLKFEPGSDMAAVAAGRVSASPLSFAWEDQAPGLSLIPWATKIADAVNQQLANPRRGEPGSATP
ncbi:5'/3'-nucleotidase SurE [Gordonia sp. TBRC 11910]|uniref:5'-nucleotidase SurE n=1 Tax=Gordonia asplenii TaxID=2725283 RepID=A0A848L0S2_9ACTN|nr:5'/3'-nucleotidase SurE [Gordonia asplenii]NMO02233.1 5'/3'-nucleotidase SurE [Gordonia asplenii]